MRYLFAVIANRTGEVLADHDEMAAIDSFNEKIEVAGQRIMAAGRRRGIERKKPKACGGRRTKKIRQARLLLRSG